VLKFDLALFQGHDMSNALNDAPYKLLFASPRLVADLVRCFVPDPWLAQFDPATLVPAPTNLITPRLQQLHSDMVWRMQAPQNHGEAIVHIEFQSQPDKNMALRMLNYLTHLLNHDAPKTGEKSDELSPVLSIVVYNGKPQWHSKRRIQDRIRRMPHGLLRRCVQHSYVLIDI
jgi:predicted transposase YdaD